MALWGTLTKQELKRGADNVIYWSVKGMCCMNTVHESLKHPECLENRFKGFGMKGWENGEDKPLGFHMNGEDVRKIWTLIKPAREDLDFPRTNDELDRI